MEPLSTDWDIPAPLLILNDSLSLLEEPEFDIHHAFYDKAQPTEQHG
jgi:hypothetical protein